MVQISSKKNVMTGVLVGAALSASGAHAAAIPGQAGLDVNAAILRLPDALPQRTFGIPEQTKRLWRGRMNRRGPWRTDQATDLINLDLSNGPHNHQGSLVNIETVPRLHSIQRGHEKRRHGYDTVIVEDEHIHRGHGYSHGHGHGHGDTVKVIGRRRHDDTVIIDDDRYHHGHHGVTYLDDGHYRHDYDQGYDHDHDHDHDHTHIHSHGDNVNIVEKRRHENDDRHRADTIIVNDGHRHHNDHTTIIDSDRHHGVTVVDKRDVIDVQHGRHSHDDKVVIVDDYTHKHHHHEPITVVHSRSDEAESSIMAKRHSGKIIVVDGDRHSWRDTDFYRHSDEVAFGRPMYFGRGDRDRVRMVDGPIVDSVRLGNGHRYVGGGWYKRNNRPDREAEAKRSHGGDDRNDRDREDRHDRDDRHGRGRHGHHGHDDVTVIHEKRETPLEMGGAPGYIDVTSPVFNSTTAQRIASLVLSTTNGTESNSSFILNASNNVRTKVYLVPSNSTGTKTEGPIRVNLKLPIFVAQSASVEPYCATFDPAPKTPGPLTVSKCMEDGTDVHSSQMFLYDPATGIIHPDWNPSPVAQAVLAAIPDSIDDDETMMSASVTDDDTEDIEPSAVTRKPVPSSSNSATPSAASASASDTGSTDVDVDAAAQSAPPPLETAGAKSSTDSTALDAKASNVTLIFTPVNPSLNQASVMDTNAMDSDSDDSVDAASVDSNPAPSNVTTRAYDAAGSDDDMVMSGSGSDVMLSGGPDGIDGTDGEMDSFPDIEGEQGPDYTAPYDWRWTKDE